MSATNHTSTIELSQYISTDKPTYLTDYNGDMIKIDNAIASDRDGITTAQNKANTADGKADANKISIDTLNEQINGDPTATPPTSGIAGKVTTLENSVNNLSSLMGNGHPTTSDQTVIGAINNIEDTIAPREDSAELGADYDTGEKFMRGGELYEALVPLTSETAFSSLTLNTDYKVADRLVKQISDLVTDIPDAVYYLIGIDDVSVTADGVKTSAELLKDLHDELQTVVTNSGSNEVIEITSVSLRDHGYTMGLVSPITVAGGGSVGTISATKTLGASNSLTFYNAVCKSDNTSVYYDHTFDGVGALTITDYSNVVPSEGTVYLIAFKKYEVVTKA